MKTLWLGLFMAVLVFGFGAVPAHSLEPSDGGISETDQDADFGDPDAFDDVDDIADGQDVDLDEDEDAPDSVRKVGLIGIWQYTKKSAGWFAGKLWVKVKGKRVFIGRVKGVFAKSLLGRHEMAGVILDRNGKYKGKIVGLYSKKGFIAKWSIKGGRREGKAKARFIVPFGRAGFLGVGIAPKENPEDDTE